MDMIMMPPPSKPAMKFTIGRCGGSWIVKTKTPALPAPRDYEEDEKIAAEALLMLAAGGTGGLFHISNSSSTAASPATTKKPKFQLPSPPPAKNINSHTCNECGKTFASHQALGGHKTSHRPKPAVSGDVVSTKNSSCRMAHECTVCHEVFRTSQALGGHKRHHVDGITAGVAVKRRRETSTSIGLGDTSTQVPIAIVVREIDLNLRLAPSGTFL